MPEVSTKSRARAQNAWSQKLNLIEVKGGTEKERMLFYSTLYNSPAHAPSRRAKRRTVRGRNQDGGVAEYDRYSPIALWDTGRNQVVLLTLLEPDVKTNILRTHLKWPANPAGCTPLFMATMGC